MDEGAVPPWLSDTDLQSPVSRLLGDRATVERWSASRLTGGSSDALGVWRLTGSALMGHERRQWSLILKGWAVPAPGVSPGDMNWPRREMELYTSGFLANLPGGIAAPACLGALDRPDGSAWLFIEDLLSDAFPPWPLARFAGLARQLGQLNGAWLDGRPLPDHPSLSRDWIRHRVEASAPFIDELRNPQAHPLVRALFPPPVAAAYLQLWDDRERQLAALARLPRTFCHLDAFPRNAFVRTGPDGREETLLIDWAFAGIAALGEELTSLIVASVVFMEAPLADARLLEAAAQEGYLDGLRDTGWRGDPDEVREGYRIAATLRYGVGAIHRWIPLLTSDRPQPGTDAIIDRPAQEAFANATGVQEWMASLVTEV